eukprot:4802121-Lingulodinium_polyedra.AAC.1
MPEAIKEKYGVPGGPWLQQFAGGMVGTVQRQRSEQEQPQESHGTVVNEGRVEYIQSHIPHAKLAKCGTRARRDWKCLHRWKSVTKT